MFMYLLSGIFLLFLAHKYSKKVAAVHALATYALSVGMVGFVNFYKKVAEPTLSGSKVLTALFHALFEKINNENRYMVESRLFPERYINTINEENMTTLVKPELFGNMSNCQVDWHALLDDPIFTSYGEIWRMQRRAIQPNFRRLGVRDVPVFDFHLDELRSLLDGQAPDRLVVIKGLFSRYTLDVSTTFLFGQDIRSLDGQSAAFADTFGYIRRIQSLVSAARPFKMLIPRPNLQRTVKLVEGILGGNPHEQLISLLLAGRDTTALTLVWLFLDISDRPDVVATLRVEIIDCIDVDRSPTDKELQQTCYLQASIEKTLRSYSAVPFNIRVAVKDTVLPRGGREDGKE